MSRANRVRLEEEASNGLTRREINASLMARDIDFDPCDEIETLAGMLTYNSRDT
jgi:hypothetical protein